MAIRVQDYRDLLRVVTARGLGYDDVQVWHAVEYDAFDVLIRVDGDLARVAALGQVAELAQFMQSKVDDALRVLRYAHRKTPRLGAGTRGYKERR